MFDHFLNMFGLRELNRNQVQLEKKNLIYLFKTPRICVFLIL